MAEQDWRDGWDLDATLARAEAYVDQLFPEWGPALRNAGVGVVGKHLVYDHEDGGQPTLGPAVLEELALALVAERKKQGDQHTLHLLEERQKTAKASRDQEVREDKLAADGPNRVYARLHKGGQAVLCGWRQPNGRRNCGEQLATVINHAAVTLATPGTAAGHERFRRTLRFRPGFGQDQRSGIWRIGTHAEDAPRPDHPSTQRRSMAVAVNTGQYGFDTRPAPTQLPCWVECPRCRKVQVLSGNALRVRAAATSVPKLVGRAAWIQPSLEIAERLQGTDYDHEAPYWRELAKRFETCSDKELREYARWKIEMLNPTGHVANAEIARLWLERQAIEV